MKDQGVGAAGFGKFEHPQITAKGEDRASVRLTQPETLWFNTGTLCNITCANCYIESSPSNDRLVYITAAEVADYLDQIADRDWPVREIGFTGGEPFMNPEMIDMARLCLERGFEVLILTNAMRPMMRKAMRDGLVALQAEFGDRLTLRISVDHWAARQRTTPNAAREPSPRRIDGMAGCATQASAWPSRAAPCGTRPKHRRARATPRSSPQHGFEIDAQEPRRDGAVPRNGRNRRGAGNHHRLLGHPGQVAHAT